jgi:hypothetical protein
VFEKCGRWDKRDLFDQQARSSILYKNIFPSTAPQQIILKSLGIV